MPDILLWPLSGARPGQGPIRRSGEFSNVRSGAFYSAINRTRAIVDRVWNAAVSFPPETMQDPHRLF